MSADIKQLMRPENLSESVLLEILKCRCIELPTSTIFKKTDLIEIYNRVARPIPQRCYNESKLLGKKLQELRIARKIPIDDGEQTIVDYQINNDSVTDKQSDSLQKKINPSTEINGMSSTVKRKHSNNQAPGQTEVKRKVQKITWP